MHFKNTWQWQNNLQNISSVYLHLSMKNFLLAVVVLVVVTLAGAKTGSPCPSEVSAQCPPLGGMAVLMAHPHYCSKYCKCVDEGLALELPCPADLLWNDVIHTCDYEHNVSGHDWHSFSFYFNLSQPSRCCIPVILFIPYIILYYLFASTKTLLSSLTYWLIL